MSEVDVTSRPQNSKLRLFRPQDVGLLVGGATRVQELQNIRLHQQRNVPANALQIPVPPAHSQQLLNDVICKAHADRPSRIPSHYGIRRHVASHERLRSHHSSVTNSYPGKNSCFVADPDIVADDHVSVRGRMTL